MGEENGGGEQGYRGRRRLSLGARAAGRDRMMMISRRIGGAEWVRGRRVAGREAGRPLFAAETSVADVGVPFYSGWAAMSKAEHCWDGAMRRRHVTEPQGRS